MSVAALEQLRLRFPDAVLATHSLHGDDTVVVVKEQVLQLLGYLRHEPSLHFDMLMDLTAWDTLGLDARTQRAVGGVPGRFQVVYHLRSMTSGKRLRIKVVLDESEEGDAPAIDSATSLWKNANWAEREVWDMYGIKFKGHPDLRRILMYEEFIGHPLRKDYPKEKRQPLVRRDFT